MLPDLPLPKLLKAYLLANLFLWHAIYMLLDDFFLMIVCIKTCLSDNCNLLPERPCKKKKRCFTHLFKNEVNEYKSRVEFTHIIFRMEP